MRKISICLGVLAGLTNPPAVSADPGLREPTPLQIEVRLQDYSNLSQSTLRIALSTAARPFAKAGVDVSWIDCTLTHRRPDERCQAPVARATRILRILPQTRSVKFSPQPGELGRALLIEDGSCGTHAYIFRDRVEAFVVRVANAPRMSEYRQVARLLHVRLLGYAMAHEIAHLLGVKHAGAGIMNEPWNHADIADILKGSLGFSVEEMRRIREAVQPE